MIRRMWPPEAIDFLRELEDEQRPRVVQANRARYDSDLIAPARELADELSKLGEPHFFRPYHTPAFAPALRSRSTSAWGSATTAPAGLLLRALARRPLRRRRHAPPRHRPARAVPSGDRRRPSSAPRSSEPRHRQRGRTRARRARAQARAEGLLPDHPRIDRLRLKSVTVHRRQRLGRGSTPRPRRPDRPELTRHGRSSPGSASHRPFAPPATH